MPRKRKVRPLLPHCNKLLIAGLAVAVLAGCSGKPVRTAENNPASTSPAAEKLPRDYDKALVLMKSGDYTAAIPVLEAFIADRPDHAGPYVNLGIAYQHAGDKDNALKALQAAIERNPLNATAHHQLGILYREQGDFTAALDAYKAALDLNPDYALAHRNIGILYDLYLQQPALALDHYRRYLALSGEPDKTVDGWVVDLERRSGTAQASALQ